MSQGPLVFISYRRVDADADAQWLADTLKGEFGAEQIFVDVDDIRGGEDFENKIRSALAGARALLAVIGPRWLSAQDEETGEARIKQEHDWVRCEIKLALESGVEVIPVLVGGESMQTLAAGLPADLFSFGKRQAMVIRGDHRRTDQQLVAERLVELGIRRVATARPEVGRRIRDFSELIEEKTRSFVGRQFVFDAIDTFLKTNPRGYFLLRGDPGIGKSAFAAQLTKSRGCVHHFNVRSAGISNAAAFLENVCAQLIVRYALEHDALPAGAGADGSFLARILTEVSASGTPAPLVIVIDALDEVDLGTHAAGANLLYLPEAPPQGVYFVLTSRRLSPVRLPLRIRCERTTFDIAQDSSDNLDDIERYLTAALERPGIREYAQNQRGGSAGFVADLAQKSQGNFMYLRHVLPEIERGAYRAVHSMKLPDGLESYYADHWRRMRAVDDAAWFEYKLPVVLALTQAKQPIPIDLLMEFSGVSHRARIRDVLNDWSEFLYETVREVGERNERLYRIYHDSFREFVAKIEEVEDERVESRAAQRRIAAPLWKNRYGLDPDEWLEKKLRNDATGGSSPQDGET